MTRLVANVTAMGRCIAILAFMVLASPAVQAVEIQRVVSPGGIEAWLIEENTVPLVAVKFAFDGGSAQDQPGKEGTANLVSGLLDEGAGDYDSSAFKRRAEALALRYSFDAGRDQFYGSFSMLSENIDASVALMQAALQAPRFAPDAVERIRGQVMSGLRRQLNDPNAMAGREWMARVYPGHPYGRASQGTLDTVRVINIDDLRRFTKDTFARDGLHVAVVGAIDAVRLAPLLDALFAGLPAEAALTQIPPATPASEPFDIALAADIPQSVIQIGGPGIDRDDPDFIAAFVLNHMLGGGTFTSRLYDEVREKRGLAYSVYSYLYPLDHGALWAGGAATRADRAAETLAIIRAEVDRIAKDGPTADELDRAKAFLTGAYALRFDTSTKIAGQLLQIQLDRLGLDYIDKRNGLIKAVTLADIKRVARRLYGKGVPYAVVVGQTTAAN